MSEELHQFSKEIKYSGVLSCFSEFEKICVMLADQKCDIPFCNKQALTIGGFVHDLNRLALRAINKGEEFKLEFDNLEMDEGKDETLREVKAMQSVKDHIRKYDSDKTEDE